MAAEYTDRPRPGHPAPGSAAPEPLSPKNARVTHLGRLVRQRRARDADGVFVLDGPVLLGEAIRDALSVRDVFLAPDAIDDPSVAAAVGAAQTVGARTWVVSGGLGPHVEVMTPHGVVAVVARPPEQLAPADSAAAALHLVLVEVSDPGNLGTLLRTAEAVGATSVVVTSGSADPWSPKVVRASAGSVWRVPVAQQAASEALARMGEGGIQRIGTAGGTDSRPEELDLSAPSAIVLGNEAHGLAPELSNLIDTWVSLPMVGLVESLNVAVAGSVLAYEAIRQRHRPNASPHREAGPDQ